MWQPSFMRDNDSMATFSCSLFMAIKTIQTILNGISFLFGEWGDFTGQNIEAKEKN